MYNVRILLAEDEAPLRNLTTRYLEREGYTVLQAENGEKALETFHQYPVDLVILDIMMPPPDGFVICSKIRSISDVPIFLLTARIQEEDKIRGFNLGIDQYITKPFSNKELIARINAIFRKKKLSVKNSELCIGCLTVNIESREVNVNSESIDLTPKEFDLLLLFLNRMKYVFTREFLIDRIWGYDANVDDRTVDTLIKRLRKKLKGAGKYIITNRGTGYMFEVKES